MRAFDASSLIYAWDNYPQTQFPAVWEWLAGQFVNGEFEITKVAYEEVKGKAEDCTEWLSGKGVTPIEEVNNAAIMEAQRIKTILGIIDDQYKTGVGENDILIIALAKIRGRTLVSEERRQPILPPVMPNYKIPAVCAHHHVQVECVNFIEIIRASGIVFR